MRGAVLAGAIPAEGIVTRLREIEELRTTGVLLFRGDGVTGEVALVQGQLATDQPARDDGEDPVDLLLSLQAGEFTVIQRLPPLPVAKGDAQLRTGSLAVHVCADLMNYCERAGLTGLLLLRNDDGRVAEIVYDRGELTGIRLEGEDAEDLHGVFGWDEGTFRIEALAHAPVLDEPPTTEFIVEGRGREMAPPQMPGGLLPPRPLSPPPSAVPSPPSAPPTVDAPRRERGDSTGQHFLKVVEVTLSSILEERESRRPGSRSGPPLPPIGKTRPSTMPPPAKATKKRKTRRDATVRVIYLGGRIAPPVVDTATRHVRTDVAGDHELPDAAPERASIDPPPPASSGTGASAKAAPASPSAPSAVARVSSDWKPSEARPSSPSSLADEAPARQTSRDALAGAKDRSVKNVTSTSNDTESKEPAASVASKPAPQADPWVVAWVLVVGVVVLASLSLLARLPPLE